MRYKPIIHGHRRRLSPRSPTYTTWTSMLTRCYNQKRPDWPYYGGRGITVCERWRTFENFLADMGERPEGLTLDRINNDGNYEPRNCRWATPHEQRMNQHPRHKTATRKPKPHAPSTIRKCLCGCGQTIVGTKRITYLNRTHSMRYRRSIQRAQRI